MPELRTQISRLSYPAVLAQAWQDAQAPRAADAPTVISTFAGCGGSSLGYAMAGYRELLAVEWDANAVATFRLNFPGVPVYHGDIAALSVQECLDLAGIQPGALDVLDGSPPCQGFSTAGKRDFADSRNQLFREYVRLLVGLQPKVFVMENVSGMIKGKMKLIFVEILQGLKAAGYTVSARLLNAMYFGVPQSRERLIFVGVRADLGILPSHPLAEQRPINCNSALGGLDNSPIEIEMLLAAGQKYVAYREWPLLRPGMKKTDVAKEGGGFSCTKFDPTKPARTIQKNDGNITMHGAMHWSEWRRFTLAEFKRFASFPDLFQFAGEWRDGVARIGNSVPPLFMRAIARHIRTQLLTASSDPIARVSDG